MKFSMLLILPIIFMLFTGCEIFSGDEESGGSKNKLTAEDKEFCEMMEENLFSAETEFTSDMFELSCLGNNSFNLLAKTDFLTELSRIASTSDCDFDFKKWDYHFSYEVSESEELEEGEEPDVFLNGVSVNFSGIVEGESGEELIECFVENAREPEMITCQVNGGEEFEIAPPDDLTGKTCNSSSKEDRVEYFINSLSEALSTLGSEE